MTNTQEPPKKKFPVDAKSYKLIKVINHGTNSTVYKAFCVPMNTTVVIKAIDLDQSTMNFLNSPTMFPSHLFHPNILNSHCTFAVNRAIWIVMPFLPAGSLQSIMSYSFPTGLPEQCIAVILQQILNLLSYLDFNGTLHRDLKPGNLLLDSKGVIKFSDFGLCALISELNSPRIPEVSGSPYWVAPEVINSSDGYSVKSDIWSLGILALELAHGRPPLSDVFGQYLSLSLTKKINQRFFPMKSSSSSSCPDKKMFSESFKDLVLQCLEQDPGKRPTLESLYKHGFFKKCKSDAFLGKKMLNGLPSLEARFQLSIESDYIEGEEKNEETSQCRVGGWKFDVESLELYPILYTVPVIDLRESRGHVRFGGEIIIEEKEVIITEEEEEEEEEEDKEVSEQFERMDMELIDVNELVDEMNEKTSRICEILTTLAKTNLQEQMRRIKSLIITHGGELPEKKKVEVLAPSPAPEMQRDDDQLFMRVLERHLKLNSDMAMELDRVNSLFSQRRIIKQSKE